MRASKAILSANSHPSPQRRFLRGRGGSSPSSAIAKSVSTLEGRISVSSAAYSCTTPVTPG
jgi:hypothetical protein